MLWVILLVFVLCVVILLVYVVDMKKVDVLLVGGGIMSLMFGVWLYEFQFDWLMMMVECFDGVVLESLNGWNNVGIGYLVFVELNYMLEKVDGKVDILKVIEINELFQILCQFWVWQVKQGVLKNLYLFINLMLYMSFVWGDDNVCFLKKCYEVLQVSLLFCGMQYLEDYDQIKQWVLLMMEGCDCNQKVVVMWMLIGIDVNFGEIMCQFVGYLKMQLNFMLLLLSEVCEIMCNVDGMWYVLWVKLYLDELL